MRGRKIIFCRLVASGLVIFSLGFYGVWIVPYHIEVRYVWIDDSKLAKVLSGKMLVHISDLHMSKIGRKESKVLSILDDLKPDIIFLTGDYVQWKGDYESALHFLSKVKAKVGIWAVMGDYDYSNSSKSCLSCYEP
jgi:predicted MPP superfamily phosphohydrolase